ncbi:MAG: hypothetical protein H0V66_00710 [Bdellovibrionales bacterium]|nr:hypothetical protein [Bdellovibrionales bacterium]
MKSLLVLITLILSLSAFATDRSQINQLLAEKGTSIAAYEIQGMKLVMGERTGGGSVLKFASVEVVFTKDEAILRKDIQNVNLQNGNRLGNLESLQAGGRHIDADQIIGVISK